MFKPYTAILQQKWSIMITLWHRLTEPADSVQASEHRYRARTLSALLLPLAVIILIGSFIPEAPQQILRGVAFATAICYVLSRTKYYKPAAILTTGILFVPSIVVASIPTPHTHRFAFILAWLVLPVLVSSLVLSTRFTLLAALLAVLLICSLWLVVIPGGFLFVLTSSLGFSIITSTLILTARVIYDQVQRARNQAEAALRKSEERYRSLTQSANDAIVSADVNGNVVSWNNGAQDIFSYSQEEIIGKQLFNLVPGRYEIVYHEEMERIRSTGESQVIGRTVELAGVRKNGDEFPVEVSFSFWGAGGEIFFSAIIRDITRRKQSEEERERLIEDLDAFAHTVAHDLKSPLSAIISYARLIEMGAGVSTEEKKKEHIRSVVSGAHRMNKMIDALLAFASMGSADKAPIEQLDMAQIVADVRQRFEIELQDSQAEIKLPDSWPQALGYAPWVAEIWANYFSNAIKYGGQPPKIELGADVPTNGKVYFWIRDNGAGLTPDEQAQLFTPFTRLQKSQADGHGLGLSIVRRIAEKLGGEVGLESEVGVGSVFRFTLPCDID